MCPTIYPSVFTSLLANVHCNESLFWFEDCGLCDTISIGSSLGLFSYFVLAKCQGNSEILKKKAWPIHVSESLTDDVDLEIGHLRARDLGLGSMRPSYPTGFPLSTLSG